MTDQKHTPTPWRTLATAEPGYAATIGFGGREGEYEEGTVANVLRAEDATLIVKAVHCHDGLVAALKELFALHEPEGRFQPSYYKPILARVRKTISLVEGRDIPISEFAAAYNAEDNLTQINADMLAALKAAWTAYEPQYVSAMADDKDRTGLDEAFDGVRAAIAAAETA